VQKRGDQAAVMNSLTRFDRSETPYGVMMDQRDVAAALEVANKDIPHVVLWRTKHGWRLETISRS